MVEMISLNEWPIGGVQEPHLDTYSNQEQSQVQKQIILKTMDYNITFNDNYRGGRTYVPDDQVYECNRRWSLFQGIYIWYGVQKVRRH